MTDAQPQYRTPQAARQGVTDRLRQQADEGPWQLADLQRQYAYDQLVERLYRIDDQWVIKGATALLARRVSVRHTVDIDVFRAGSIADVERKVREAARLDIGDWMRFEVGRSVSVLAAGAQGARVRVRSSVGTRLWMSFQIDMVSDGIVMTGEPDEVPPLTVVADERTVWRAYPLVDHVADKVCAIIERHDGRPSTRYKDLVDLVAIAMRGRVEATAQTEALASEAERRALRLPARFEVPDRSLWEPGYRMDASRTTGLPARTLDDALVVVRPFLDPVLDGTVAGTWNPKHARWEQRA